MKKTLLSIILVAAVALILAGCRSKTKLNILNWGDYIDESLFDQFEADNNVDVEITYTDSNENMYTKITSKTVAFDIAVPSDYMVEKLYKEGWLNEIDFSKLSNYQEGMFLDDLETYRNSYFENNKNYAIPYFWGTLGIMYTTAKEDVVSAVEANGWNIFFEPNLMPEGSKLGMYYNPRDAVAVAELYLGKSLNTTSDADLTLVENTLKAQNADFSNLIWGTDNLKTDISAQNLDAAVVYSGDFFDQYYIADEEGLDQNFNLFVPSNTNVWFDAMVIPTTSKHVDLAHKFIDYFLDTDVALQNTNAVGYCPTNKAVYQALLEDPDWADVIENYPFYPIPEDENFHGEIYEDLGKDIYDRFATILENARAQ